MKRLVLLMHVSLDGFVAGQMGEMDWIKLDPAMFDFVGKLTDAADTAMYGRMTFNMMENYWPTAADKPNATKHDKEHSAWYKKVHKVVLSRSLKDFKRSDVTILSDHVTEEITKLKQQSGKDIIMFGSPSASHSIAAQNLFDDYWLFINPILLGQGIPLFKHINKRINLKFIESKLFADGVLAVHYVKKD